MPMRIYDRDVTLMFGRLLQAAESLAIKTDSWYVSMGSASNGISYKLNNVEYEGQTIHLGINAREAYTALQNMSLAWEIIPCLTAKN